MPDRPEFQRLHRRPLLRHLRQAALSALIAAAAFATDIGAQQQTTITPNYKDADLATIVEAVSAISGKNFIIDPRVRAQVTMLSSTPMSADAFYEAFLSILQVHGFVAVPSGNVIKIIPDANARQVPANDLPGRVSSESDEVVTQVIAVRNISAAQLVPILRPLIPQYGHLAAYPASNMLIISDRANNVYRMMRIIQRIDSAGDEEVDIVPLTNASATEVVRVVNTLYGVAGEGAGPNLKLVSDDRTNSVLVSGDKSQRLRVKALIAHLDTPLEAGGDTQVRYLRYADAESIAAKLKEQVQGIQQAAPAGAAPAGSVAAAERNVTIWADVQTNALVITAPPKIMKSIMSIVDRLDIRRAQIQVEAILVEVTADKTTDLGINWLIDGTGESGNTVPVGAFIQPVAGTSILDIARGIDDPSTLTTGLLGGTLGVGRFQDSGTNWAAVLRAVSGDADTNIISTPSVVTLDNEEAEIKIAQEVPFLTGQFTNTGATGGSVNPFQTIQREEVGNILKITPQINEGDAVMLKIEQEASSLAQGSQGAVDLITNKRTISTSVLVEDGGIIVLGGLIEDQLRESVNKIPLLGSIPLLGELFKTRSVSKVKTNLMVFIRPTILRDGTDAAIATNAKYNMVRDRQLTTRGGKVLLMPKETRPVLPPLEEMLRTPPAAADDASDDAADKFNEAADESPPP